MARSKKYNQALADHDAALREYNAAALAYRTRKIDDAEFLIARQLKVLADKAFDLAFEKETANDQS